MQRVFTRRKMLIAALLLINVVHYAQTEITVSKKDLSIKLDNTATITLLVSGYNFDSSSLIHFDIQHTDIVRVHPSEIEITNSTNEYNVTIEAIGAGHSEVVANATNYPINVEDVYVRVTVYKIGELDTFSLVIGWIYFAAWSVSFYPQIYINFKRRSVVGLNFDFLALNIVGFIMYSIFNVCLYSIPEIKDEYSSRFPRGLNPVQINDIVFAVHAVFATVITIVQCFFYERNQQRVSIVARIILGIFALFIFISIILAGTDVIHWLDFLYYCSYVKLAITLIKYVPQAYMNYKRKSTVGWSIGNILLDFTGGILSMLQMIINSYNYDDWVSIFGDPTKFGLGLFSVIFDIFFMIQHYILYRHTSYEEP